jgi:hypothetical protein
MTIKNCTKSPRRRSKHQLFHTLHPYGSTTVQKNIGILPFWLYEHLQMTINYSSLFNWPSRKRNEHKLFPTGFIYMYIKSNNNKKQNKKPNKRTKM